jgi:hypothetical protein
MAYDPRFAIAYISSSGESRASASADTTDCCNFHREDSHSTCDKPAVTAVIVTDTNGHGVLLKLCRRHLSRLSIHLIEKLE